MSWSNRFRSLLTVLTILALCACSKPSSSGPFHLTLWLDYTPWGAHVPIFAAQNKGYFRQQGIDLSIRTPPSVSDPIKLVANNSSSIGIGYMSDIVTAESKGIPVVSVGALVQHHLNCIMTLKSSGITSPKQMAGKTIGAAETPADDVILNTVFRKAGVLGKVSRVNVNYDYVPALLTHRVDAIEGAYQVWERIQIERQGQRVNVIQLQHWGVPDEYELVLVASHSAISQHPEVLRRFMRALSQGERFSVRHPSAAVNLFEKSNANVSRYLVSRSWRLLTPLVQTRGLKFGSQSASRWSALSRWMFRNRLVSSRVRGSHLFTNRFLP